jgi:hypothetical protein
VWRNRLAYFEAKQSNTMNWTTAQQGQLVAAIQRRNERDVWQQQLNTARNTLKEQLEQQQTLYDQLLKEEKDVDRLERLSWAKLYYDLLNQRDEQLAKERLEAEAALSRYEQVKEQTTQLQQRVHELEQKQVIFTDIDVAYDKLIEQKTGALLVQSGPVYAQYREHVDALAVADKQLQELKEAHQAGLTVLDQVLHLVKLLDEAHSWGNWDMMTSSTVLSWMKYQKLDEVKQQSRAVGGYLRLFQNELADVHQTMHADWQFTDDMTRFFDIFFDNFLIDWSVQRRIGKARHEAHMLEERLVFALKQLKQQLDNTVDSAQKANVELRQFLEMA